ncbi:hypothetical protein HIC20_01155 [Buchnera aphidicola (Hormaphis cornu)]|nr:hypothetical protein HIC20_01155 [Buchnera aphidicola (Hormaphis cornu)]
MIRNHFLKSKSIFVLPSLKKELFQRLQDRLISNLESVYARMQEVLSDVIHYVEYDYVIVNDNFKHTVLEIKKLYNLNV